MSERFYINCPLAPGPIELNGPEAHHLAQVCRLRAGDAVLLFNGDGREYQASVQHAERRLVTLDVVSVHDPERELPFTLELAAPLPKGDRAQFLIEKLTEIGVTAYVPLDTERSIIVPREGKMEKLERYVVEASKQCGRNVLMSVGALTSWKDYAAPRSTDETRVLLDREGDAELPPRIDDAPMRIALGPEGGLSPEERRLAAAHGWHFLRLGPRILRIETAALVAATLASAGRHSHIR